MRCFVKGWEKWYRFVVACERLLRCSVRWLSRGCLWFAVLGQLAPPRAFCTSAAAVAHTRRSVLRWAPRSMARRSWSAQEPTLGVSYCRKPCRSWGLGIPKSTPPVRTTACRFSRPVARSKASRSRTRSARASSSGSGLPLSRTLRSVATQSRTMTRATRLAHRLRLRVTRNATRTRPHPPNRVTVARGCIW